MTSFATFMGWKLSNIWDNSLSIVFPSQITCLFVSDRNFCLSWVNNLCKRILASLLPFWNLTVNRLLQIAINLIFLFNINKRTCLVANFQDFDLPLAMRSCISKVRNSVVSVNIDQACCWALWKNLWNKWSLVLHITIEAV